MEGFLLQLFIFLASACIAVPLAKKFKLGSVLGYLIAGIIIGPYGLSLIGNIETIMHFTEFGVVMMLFLIGLELKPSLLWKMKTPILGMGGAQVVLTSIIIFAIAYFFIPWQQALAIGLILALSSTAIVLQTLREKGLMNTNAGRSVFSVLLFQDLAVIPILSILPLLATFTMQSSSSHESVLFNIHTLPNYLQVIVTFLAVALILILGKFASSPIFRIIAQTKVREIFVATALSLIVGISILMSIVGLSPALGTFLAGVVLANSEYRHELESDIEPFKGLLLGVFFISIGASLNFTLINDNTILIVLLVLGLLGLKALALYITSIIFKVAKEDRSLFAISLAQGGEFAFVLFQFSKTNGILQDNVIDPLISAVAISMFLTPLLFIVYEKFLSKEDDNKQAKQEDKIEYEDNKVIIAGFGRLGTDLGRFLISCGIKPIIIDNNVSQVELLRKFGFEVYYGDITRPDLLESAGAAQAKLLIITISDSEKAKELVDLSKKHYPNLKIAANAHNRAASYDLMDLGVSTLRMETFGSAIRLGQDCLEVLGYDPYEALKMARVFKKKDSDMFPTLYKMHRTDEKKYINMFQEYSKDLEEIMNEDKKTKYKDLVDCSWRSKNPEE